MIASSALTVPYQRLKPRDSFIQSIQDRTHYERASAQLSQLLKEPFLSSPLWNTGSVSSWASGDLVSVNGSPDEWPELTHPSAMSDTELVSSVIATMRHALAHGNLYMQAEMWDQTTRFVFVTGVATTLRLNDREITLEDLEVGDAVRVAYDIKDGKIVATSITLERR